MREIIDTLDPFACTVQSHTILLGLLPWYLPPYMCLYGRVAAPTTTLYRTRTESCRVLLLSMYQQPNEPRQSTRHTCICSHFDTMFDTRVTRAPLASAILVSAHARAMKGKSARPTCTGLRSSTHGMRASIATMLSQVHRTPAITHGIHGRRDLTHLHTGSHPPPRGISHTISRDLARHLTGSRRGARTLRGRSG